MYSGANETFDHHLYKEKEKEKLKK